VTHQGFCSEFLKNLQGQLSARVLEKLKSYKEIQMKLTKANKLKKNMQNIKEQ